MDALALLKDDRDNLKKLLKHAEKKESAADRRAAFEDIAREPRMHEKLEEELLYPALKQHPRARDTKRAFDKEELERMGAQMEEMKSAATRA